MGPLLLASGPDEHELLTLWPRALAQFRRLTRQQPAIEKGEGGWRVALCPPLFKPALAGWSQGHDGSWKACSGAFFYDRQFASAALEAIPPPAPGDLEYASVLGATDGAFCLAIGQPLSGDLTIISDRLGTLHAYHTTIGNTLLVCTSSLVLSALRGARWNLTACRQFLATGSVFESNSLFEGIEKFPPASVTRFREGRFEWSRRYWEVNRVLWDGAPQPGGTPALAAALTQSMDTIGRNFQRPVLDLTGGLDSRAILGAMRRAGHPFSTVVNGSGDAPDVRVANRIATALSLDHRQQQQRPSSLAECWEDIEHAVLLLDGEYDPLLYCNVLDVHRRIASSFDVSVNGSNGEICKGYWWELLFPHIGRRGHFSARALAKGRFVYAGEPAAGMLAHSFDDDIVSHFAAIIERANAPLAGLPNTAHIDHAYLALRMQRWQGRIASATLRLWPAVSPFAFRAPMECALSAPASIRVRHRMSRRLIETLDPALSRIPLDSGYPAAPLRWNNWPAFAAPFLSDVKSKLKRRLLGSSAVPVPKQSLAELLSLPQVQDLMSEPGKMRTGELYRERELAAFVRAARQPGFGGKALFGRVMTLEMAARLLRA